jgi:hypothetical protein
LKTIIDISTMQIMEVPDTHVECRCCGRYMPSSNYMAEKNEVHYPTDFANCQDCRKLDLNAQIGLKTEVGNMKKTVEYQNMKQEMK